MGKRWIQIKDENFYFQDFWTKLQYTLKIKGGRISECIFNIFIKDEKNTVCQIVVNKPKK